MKIIWACLCIFAQLSRHVVAVDLAPVVRTPEQFLFCGDTPIAIGTVEAAMEGENLEVHVDLFPFLRACEIKESHICNIPAPTQEGGKFAHYSIPVETVYDFACRYDSDSFMVAGHVTVECNLGQDEFHRLVDGNLRRKLEVVETTGVGHAVLAAYYEIPLSCEAPENSSNTKELSFSTTTSTTTVSPHIS